MHRLATPRFKPRSCSAAIKVVTVYLDYFSEPLPTRSAFAVNGLALGGLVELECQAYAGKK